MSEVSGVPACPKPEHAGSRVRRRGLRPAASGPQQRFECVLDGAHHFFTRPLDRPTARPKPRRVRCPEAGHADARVAARGTRRTKAGTWARYRCTRPDGSVHHFQVMARAVGKTLTSLDVPPECPEHEDSKVTRHGSFGRGSRRRQRYRCVPVADEAHTFVPPLSRETVEVGSDTCATCDELLSPHSGELTGARHTPWSLKAVAKALNDLSLGASYAKVSLAMREHRDLAVRHLHEAHGIDLLAAGAGSASGSWTTKQGKTAWHLAADLVEQYAPLLFEQAVEAVVKREQRQRAANDAALAADPSASLAAPLTYILDELPVVLTRRRKAARNRFQQAQWSLLVVVEVRWRPAPDPMTLPSREARLRMVRAYPRGNQQAWRLVLNELPVRPDYIVADSSLAITGAVNAHYGPGAVGLIPSLFHVHRNIRDGLMELTGTTTKVEGRAVLIPQLAKHMDVLTRDELLNRTAADWSRWWDELIAAVAALPAPVVKLTEQRKMYEPRLTAALPLLARQPQLPASNAAVETRMRLQLEPFLDNRKHLYRNLARTNFLFDLAVARDQGAFGDLDAVAKAIRDSNETAGGWAPAPRLLADAQPPPREDGTPSPGYSSLLNPLLVAALADKRLGGAS
ncbi:hypothetical protein JD79_01745 [Geodermatophilus normandii]|uniref:Uncharacterized protein n=1 Tax=Geodermatophilus normandii TaxID=1137989 RepID=A0A317QIG3_9ACTN|nr:hypothetical protein [Geodermatophilus normandii]PWW22587.1 hypothetical protein JD79_01745 [Geodermatophilus normandii]